jgi:hypothetical protein
MRGKDFNTGLRGVLFEAHHYERMGQAVWLYGWLVLRQTRQEGTMGLVLGGRPISYREIEEETGFSARTLERWMRVLRREGYVVTQATPSGVVVRITKAKKFPQGCANRRGAVRRFAGTGPRFAGPSPQSCGGLTMQAQQNTEEARRICSSYVVREKKAMQCGASDNHSGEDERQRSLFTENLSKPPIRSAAPEEGPREAEAPRPFRAWRRESREELVRRELCVGQGPEVRRGRE